MLYHFGFSWIGGGFVGVDIFFVISGFLIGGILWKEQRENGRISLARFYLRRFRRLAPAFFAMAALTSVFAWLILLPFEFREFGKSLIAATFYLANVLFYRSAGYFDSGSEDKILLHTWSLSVEEQFYVFLPLILILLVRWPRILVMALWVLFAVSAVLCFTQTQSHPSAAFYLFPFRAWELLAGVLLAITGHNKNWSWSIHPAFSWFGFVILVIALIFIRPGPTFPGLQAVAPVIGGLLILVNGCNTNAINRALASPVPIFIGLISYSLYLWHWPVLTLSRYYRDGYSGLGETAAWILLSILLAVLSWRFIERPFRSNPKSSFWRTLLIVALASATAAGFGAYAYLTDGAPNRFRPEARVHIAATGDFLQDWSRCETRLDGPFAGIETCAIGPDGPPEVLVWGDSHARAYMDGIATAATETTTSGLLIWHAGCPPVFDLVKQETAATPAQDRACQIATEGLRNALPNMKSLKRILLIGRWNYYVTGQGVGLDANNKIILHTPETVAPAQPQHLLFGSALTRTVADLRDLGTTVYILRQTPEIPMYDSRRVARALAHGAMTPKITASFKASLSDLTLRGKDADKVLAALRDQGEINLIDPWPLLCTNDTCSVMRGDHPIYFDNNHLTNTGAMALRRLFLPFLKGNPQ